MHSYDFQTKVIESKSLLYSGGFALNVIMHLTRSKIHHNKIKVMHPQDVIYNRYMKYRSLIMCRLDE